jgi:YD repeat-containing protein
MTSASNCQCQTERRVPTLCLRHAVFAVRRKGCDKNNRPYRRDTAGFFASGAMKEFATPNFNNNKFHMELNNRLQPTEIWAGPAQGATALFDKQYQYNAPSTTQMNNGNIYTVTNVKDSSRTQTFTYDVLNRLASAQDNGHWANTYSYDAWGNLLTDGINSWTYVYDAENRIAAAGGTTYTYDIERGKREVGIITLQVIARGLGTTMSYLLRGL